MCLFLVVAMLIGSVRVFVALLGTLRRCGTFELLDVFPLGR